MEQPRTGLSILVVDDEPGLAATLRRVLEYGGYRVDGADSGAEAIRKLGEARYDAVITDIFLPDVDGPQIIAAARKQQPQARILAISGGGAFMTSPEVLTIATKLGADGVLMKPFTPAALLEAIAKALAAR